MVDEHTTHSSAVASPEAASLSPGERENAAMMGPVGACTPLPAAQTKRYRSIPLHEISAIVESCGEPSLAAEVPGMASVLRDVEKCTRGFALTCGVWSLQLLRHRNCSQCTHYSLVYQL